MGRMISPRELTNVEIKAAVRGYDRDEVNDLLEKAAATIEAANDRVQQLTDRLAQAQAEAGRSRETEDVLQRTLLMAQRAADEAIAEADAKAREVIDAAEAEARRIREDAEAEARRTGDAERRRVEEEAADLAARRDALLADVEAMTRFESEYRDRMVRALEADLAALRARPSTSPGPRPSTSGIEVDVPDAEIDAEIDAEVDAETGAETDRELDSDADAADDTRAVDVRAFFAPVAEAQPLDDEPVAAVLFDDAPPEPREIDLLREAIEDDDEDEDEPDDELGDGVSLGEHLDDDAFFASLREAASDDAPLGPRDEALERDRAFLTGENERVGFRDVFRRRR